MPNRTVFFLSDGTGITAETFGNAILAQFETNVRRVRLPFLDSVDKAHQAVRQINHTAEVEGKRPLVFATVVNMDVLAVVKEQCHCVFMDMFGTFVEPLEDELGIKSNHRVGRFSDASKSKEYNDRIEAINFSLMHDDGQSHKDLESSDVILVGVSRSGKTPTSLYLAMQHGLKASNYPLIPEDFDRRKLPPALVPHRKKIFGLTIAPERLAEIRNERRPNSRYASLENCRAEVNEAEAMMRYHHPAGNPAGTAGVLIPALLRVFPRCGTRAAGDPAKPVARVPGPYAPLSRFVAGPMPCACRPRANDMNSLIHNVEPAIATQVS
jgi:[pyruvate, water dikinase]-phosphate phosphotransferase / [pyruvate, water dikinase] kinase